MITLSSSVKLARSTALRQAIDAANDPGKLLIYSGARPAIGAPATGLLLATIDLTRPCGIVDQSGLRLMASGPSQATGTGLASWARLVDGDGKTIFDADCKQVDDARAAELVFDVAQMYPGAFVTLVSAVIAEGG